MRIRETTLDDIELLIKLRLDFIIMIGAELSDENKHILRIQLDNYYRKHILLGDFIAYLAEDEHRIMAAAFMVIGERPAGMSFITGITGTILNVITYPEFRNNGYATLLFKSLIHKAKKLNVTAIDLNATQMGEKVYQHLGFATIEDTAMRLIL